MNVRQQLYKKYRFDGYSKYTSARKAGYSHSYASQAKRVEKHINMDFWLENEGLTDTALAEHAKQGLNATKVLGYLNNKAKGTEKVSDEFIEVPDWSVRHKYMETILKLRDKLTDKPLIDQSQHTHITKVELKISNETNSPLAQESGDRLSERGKIQGPGRR